MTDPEVALMCAFARGEEAAFVTLYRTYRDRIIAYCTRLLGDRARAEEAAQDVFIKLYGTRDTYTERGQFSSFLYRIATNHCFNLRAQLDQRLTDRRKALDDDSHSASTREHDPAGQLANAELRSALAAALAELPDKQRAAFVLVHYQELAYRDAAAALQVSEAAVKSLIHRARISMMQRLEPHARRESEVVHAM